jgi:glutamate 5-kinase
MSREYVDHELGDRIVVKVGTSSIVTDGRVDLAKAELLCEAVSTAISAGLLPVLVISGAIAIGRFRHQTLNGSSPGIQQTAAAIGQGVLYGSLQRLFASRDLETGQVLLTPLDLLQPERNDRVRQTFDAMHSLGFVPVVNENDALGVRNNDVLAAILCGYLRARLLLLLTNVPGLYDANPSLDERATPIAEVVHVTPELEAVAAGAVDGAGTGGMTAKLAACQIATYAGVRVVITNVLESGSLVAAYHGGQVGTVFLPHRFSFKGEPADLGRLWRAFREPPRGSVVCSSAGVLAVERCAALQRRDATIIDGSFDVGDVVDITDPETRLIARGSIRFDSVTAEFVCPPDADLFISTDYAPIRRDHLCQ